MTEHYGLYNTMNTGYSCKKYHGKVSVITQDDKYNSNNMEEVASRQDLQSMVLAIQKDDLDQLASLLNQNCDKNISSQLVGATLPKRWHHVAKNVMSTPLRAAITWRNTKALKMILKSKCIVEHDDICAGLQKIIRHLESPVERHIVEQLVKHGATLENPIHFTNGFGKRINAGQSKICHRAVKGMCQANPSNNLLGQLLLSVSKQSNMLGQVANLDLSFQENWASFAVFTSKFVISSGFDPSCFIEDTKVWLSFGRTTFQNQIQALPLMVQVMTRCPVHAFAWILRQTGRYYPHIGSEGKRKIRQLPRLLWEAGVNLPMMLKVACLSPRFLVDTGFHTWTRHHKTKTRTLQQHCRNAIRTHITAGNVYCGVERMTNIPRALKDYILMRDVQALPWDDVDIVESEVVDNDSVYVVNVD